MTDLTLKDIERLQGEISQLRAELEAERAKSERTSILIESLTTRADWLRSEGRDSADYNRLKAREDECLYIYDRLKNRIRPFSLPPTNS